MERKRFFHFPQHCISFQCCWRWSLFCQVFASAIPIGTTKISLTLIPIVLGGGAFRPACWCVSGRGVRRCRHRGGARGGGCLHIYPDCRSSRSYDRAVPYQGRGGGLCRGASRSRNPQEERICGSDRGIACGAGRQHRSFYSRRPVYERHAHGEILWLTA